MLSALTINNIVLIDRLDLDFTAGFSVLTGETGAGKSILLDSLGLVLGQRADASLIRKGQEKASVTAEFQGEIASQTQQILYDADIVLEANEPLVIRRNLNQDGRSRAYINDTPVSVGLLRQIAAALVDIHSQFETHALLDSKTHIDWLDQFMNQPTLLNKVRLAWDALRESQKKLDHFQQALATAREDQEFWSASIEALDLLAPQEGEEDALTLKREQSAAREQILDRLDTALHALEADEGAIAKANQAWKSLDRSPVREDALIQRLDQGLSELQDIAAAIQDAQQSMIREDQSVEDIDDRLIALRAEARKHECTCDALSAKRDELALKLSDVIEGDDRLLALQADLDQAVDTYNDAARALSNARVKAGEKLSHSIMRELTYLKLDKAVFAVQVTHDNESRHVKGCDAVIFALAANPGQSPAPLHKAASGGELSRVMLAMKTVFSALNPVQTMIFDEIDSGMGGATADAMGHRLYQLSQSCQVFAVTHAPQIAAMGDAHFIVSKQDNADSVQTSVTPLHDQMARREEVARMLSGASITAEARAAAEALLTARDVA